ncbi:PAS domain-containing sensor histidine kinase [Halorientalis halophila]|uniref:PAS domain-containing sensor histidine kinase n=1 Tax=Halorientalis halophila TaxID=3108499 RepID=UPI00300978C9
MTPDDLSYRPHFERAPIGIFELDDQCEYVDANPFACELVGYSREELHGMSITDLAPEGDDFGDLPSFTDVSEAGAIRTDGAIRRKDGTVIEVRIEAATLDDDRFVAYVQDISEQKEHERRLENQLENLEILNQVLRHDVRNDLQLVTAYTDLLADNCDTAQEAEYLEKIATSADHAVELTDTAREIADVMRSVTLDEQLIDLQRRLEKEVSEIRSSYSEAAITCETPIPAVRVQANEMIASVFRNLLKNAIQHNDKPMAEVTVSVTEDDETVTVRIADNGPGVADDQKEAIFGKGERNLNSAGTGIGLYLVDSLVTSYSGSVWVEDNEPEGSVFVVQLPKAE